ncbi:uncharacterized protein LOC127278051 [Leptopilina boulardi]|uniref:uncharacterized protein LOC127278051 n=1 Tax=Leptopilina boulardi TaxID=63433 RepID=UPI0021F5135A|nr:uncharacterized protein LOC127278051 [Leptopilina boulardi]
MKYLKAVLLIAFVNGYVSFATAEKKPFKSFTIAELKQLCYQQNINYNSLTKPRNLTETLIRNTITTCKGSANKQLIIDLVNEILPCFDNENKPNKIELETIYEDIKEKACILSEIVNFRMTNVQCLGNEDSPYFTCVNENSKKLKSDPLFYILAMTHSDEECPLYASFNNCAKEAVANNCASEAQRLENILNKFMLSMNCTYTFSLNQSNFTDYSTKFTNSIKPESIDSNQGYVSFVTAEKKPFKSYTFTELKQLCNQQNKNYDTLIKARNITQALIRNTTSSCNSTTNQQLIIDLVDDILPCFDNDNKPNEIDLVTIYEDITTKVCIYYDIVNFRIVNWECFGNKSSSYFSCGNKILKNKFLISDMLFYVLAMTHSDGECNLYTSLNKCAMERVANNCNSEIHKLENLQSKFMLSMNCTYNLNLNQSNLINQN